MFTARGAYKFMELGKEHLTSVAPPPPASVLLSTETQQLVLIGPTRRSSVVRTPCFHREVQFLIRELKSGKPQGETKKERHIQTRSQ